MFITAADIIIRAEASGLTLPSDAQAALLTILPASIRSVEQVIGFRIQQGTGTEYFPSGTSRPLWDPDTAAMGWEKIGPMVVQRGGISVSTFQLREIPVRSIIDVNINPAAWLNGTPAGDWPNTTIAPVSSYQLEYDTTANYSTTGLLYRIGYAWPSLPRSVRVRYTYGWTENEIKELFPEIVEAIAITAMIRLRDWIARSRTLLTGPLNSISIEDFSASFAENYATNGGAGMTTAQKSPIPPEAAALLNPHVNVAAFFGS